jgi:PUA domain protein
MFKKFSIEESVSSTSQIKNSVQRSICNQISEQYPLLADVIDDVLPKKSMLVAKAADNVQLIVVNNEIVFFNQRDGPFFPTLRVLHRYPTMMPRMQTDKGAIRFVLGGANIMCPGFTSKGGSVPDGLAAETPVAIYAEGKQHAMAVGITKMSRDEMFAVNKGIAVETVTFLMDGMWQEAGKRIS